jgi:predicted GIY-YIG superfamily endonuclease
MMRCKFCMKYRHEIDEHGACVPCKKKRAAPPVHLYVEQVDLNRSVAYHGGGYIFSRGSWMDIRKKLDAYYANTSDDEIDEFNQHLRALKSQSKQTKGLPGYIYLLSSSVGYYKIGRAKDVSARMGQHKRDYPVTLTVEHTIAVADMIRSETFLLRTFRDKKLQGEWFALGPDDVTWIKGLDSKALELLTGSTSVFDELESPDDVLC